MKRTRMTEESQHIQQHTEQNTPSAERDRQQDIDRAISAIENSKLDGRTVHSKRLLATRRMLADKPVSTALGLVKDTLAVNATIVSCLIQEMGKADFQILDEQGNLNPILAKHWPEAQKAILNGAQSLVRLEQAIDPEKPKKASTSKGTTSAPSDNDIVDVSTLVIELTQANKSGETDE